VVSREDWESGALDSSFIPQCTNVSSTDEWATRGTFSVISPGAQGNYAARFDLPADRSKDTACEVGRWRTAAPGSDDYYALDVMFPSNWQEPGDTSVDANAWWGMVISSLNYPRIWGAPVGLSAHSDRVVVTLQTGLCAYGSGCTYTNGAGGEAYGPNVFCVPSCQIIPKGQLTLGSWHQLIVHVHWATGSDGMVEGWWRRKGTSNWQKTVSITGVPTEQWGTDVFGNVWTPSNLANEATVDKFGAYRPQSTAPLSVYHDGWCRATSFDAAQSCL
jgi:hypothetical protein